MFNSQRWAELYLCRWEPPRCRSAGRWAQRAAGASGGPGQGLLSERVSGSERLGTGPCGDDGTGSMMTSGCWVFPKGPGSAGSVHRGRGAWSTSPDPPKLICVLGFWSLFLLLLSLQLKIFVCLFNLFSSRCLRFSFLDVYLSSPLSLTPAPVRTVCWCFHAASGAVWARTFTNASCHPSQTRVFLK